MKTNFIPKHTHPHRHKVILPGDIEILTSREIDFDDTVEAELDDELGQLAELGEAGLKVGTKLIGKAGEELIQAIFGKDKKEIDPYAKARDFLAQQTAPMETGSYSGIAGLTAQEVQYIVKDLLTQLPPHVRSQMRNAITESKAADLSSRDLQRVISDKVNSDFMPKINELMNVIKLGNTQTEATNEHRKMLNSQRRWRDNYKAQQQLMNKLVSMENKLSKISGKRR
jgi:hypothetical protein